VFNLPPFLHSAGRIRICHSDNAREFKFEGEYSKLCEKERIERHFAPPYQPQGNSAVERLNGSISSATRTTCGGSTGVDVGLWDFCGAAVVYVKNRLGGKESPFYRRYGFEPSLSVFRKFGCLAYAHNYVKGGDPSGAGKYNERATRGVFLGYCLGGSSYLVGVFKPDKRARSGYSFQVIESRSVGFDETTTITSIRDLG
jgi:hypothetical protein